MGGSKTLGADLCYQGFFKYVITRPVRVNFVEQACFYLYLTKCEFRLSGK